MDYSKYYWQNDLVRLRPMRTKDQVHFYANRFDSVARRKLQYELELPPLKENEIGEEEIPVYDGSSGRYSFSIETLEGEFVGSFNLNSVDERNGTFSIGMQIDQNCRGKGYGTSAMSILLDYAFNERRLHKFNVSVIEDNIASATMLKKLGCQREGIRREVIYMAGQYHNEILYGLTNLEFNQYNQKNKG